MRTDKDWKKWGQNNPYFGVISHDRYAGKELDAKQLEAFYDSGKGEVARVMNTIQSQGGPKQFRRALDFGCGVGRLAQPLAAYAEEVVGLDVSPEMIKLARQNTPEELEGKLDFSVSDNDLGSLPRSYDLVHSYIVLQHIPRRAGMRTMGRLLEGLEDGGFAALHVTYRYRAPRWKKLVIWLRERVLPLRYLFNLYKKQPLSTPAMRMHTYDLDEVLDLYREHGIKEPAIKSTNHGGYLGAMIIGQKQ